MTQHKDNLPNETQHNDIEEDNTRHISSKNRDTQHKDSQNKNTQHNKSQLNETQNDDPQHNYKTCETYCRNFANGGECRWAQCRGAVHVAQCNVVMAFLWPFRPFSSTISPGSLIGLSLDFKSAIPQVNKHGQTSGPHFVNFLRP
jgi:hypothetical protein